MNTPTTINAYDIVKCINPDGEGVESIFSWDTSDWITVGSFFYIRHSAGSGKSNSIAWLTHQLSVLHNHQNRNDVIT